MMFKKLFFVLCISLTSTHISAFSAEKSTLLINDADWPPFFIHNETSTLQGIVKDLIAQCNDKSKYITDYIKLPIKRTHQFMRNGVLDITAYSYKPSRETFLLYSKQPLFSSEYAFIVPAGSDIVVKTLDDLTPYRLAYISGVSYNKELLNIFNNKKLKDEVIVGYNIDSMLSKLQSPIPRFDIMIYSLETFLWHIQQKGMTNKVKALDYQFIPKEYFLAISKKSKNIIDKQGFIDKFDQCLLDIKSTGEYQNILAKYGIIPRSNNKNLQTPPINQP